MENLLIKYEPVVDYVNAECEKYLLVQYNSRYVKSKDIYFHDVRFTGWTAVGKIEGNKMYIAFSVCKYEEGDKFVKKVGVQEALAKCTPEKATVIVNLADVPQNEIIKVFHGYVDSSSEKLEKRFFKKRVRYWLSKV